MNFRQLQNDPCIYTQFSEGETFITAIYLDNIILACKSLTHIQEFIKTISKSFNIKDTGKLHHFLGVKITYLESVKIWIRQSEYTE